MKRTLSLLTAMTFAVSLAPAAQATEPSVEKPTASPAVATPVSTPFAETVVRASDERARCTFMCVQTSLPFSGSFQYFVNDDRAILTIGESKYNLRSVDTRKVIRSGKLPKGVTLTREPALSKDTGTLLIATETRQDVPGLYLLNTQTLSRSVVTPSGNSYPLSGGIDRMTVAENGDSFYLGQRFEGAIQLCKFDSSGDEVDCADDWFGPGVSDLFLSEDESQLFFGSSNDDLFTVNTATMAYTSVNIGATMSFGYSAMDADGTLYFADPVYYGQFPDSTPIYAVGTDGVIRETYQLPGALLITDMVAPSGVDNQLYVTGFFKTDSITYEQSNTVIKFDTLGEFELVQSLSMNPVKRNSAQRLAVDSEGRYVIATGLRVISKVIPVSDGSSLSITVSTENVSPGVWDINWNYLSFAPTKPVKKFDVYYREPGGSTWSVAATVSAAGNRSYRLTGVEEGGAVKVLPKAISVESYDTETLEP